VQQKIFRRMAGSGLGGAGGGAARPPICLFVTWIRKKIADFFTIS